MNELHYIDRKSHERRVEKIYGEKSLRFLYRESVISSFLLFVVTRCSFLSSLFGFWQLMPWTKKKIAPFIKAYDVDPSEFEKSVEEFSSFNDFFIRQLKPEARPIDSREDAVILPADCRVKIFPSLHHLEVIEVKGRKFSLERLLGSLRLAERFRKGSLVICRLAPMDYHRFHFPLPCVPSEPKLITGTLYSVNPLMIRENFSCFFDNKRYLTELLSDHFGKVCMVEVGATNVGSIHETYQPYRPVIKGEEKGFFSFGGSAILLFFEEKRIRYDDDLLAASFQGIETYCQMGQSLGLKNDSSHFSRN